MARSTLCMHPLDVMELQLRVGGTERGGLQCVNGIRKYADDARTYEGPVGMQ